MNTIYLITGSNLGNRKDYLLLAQKNISEKIGPVMKSSSVYETESWGNTNQPSFYNQVHLVETSLSAEKLIKSILKIEKEMGRLRTTRNASRIIDIDILFFNNEIINVPGLTIPHPEIQNRRFVLMPMNELNPDFIHPVFMKNIKKLLKTCTDTLQVKLIPEILNEKQRELN